MELSTKNKVIASSVVILVSFATGRYTVPEKVKVETKVVEVEKKTDTLDKNQHKVTTVVIVKKPDGTVQTEKTTTQDSNYTNKETNNVDLAKDTTKETDKDEAKVTVAALVGLNVFNGQIKYGAQVYKPVIGPIGIGVFGLSDGTAGCSVGISF